MVFKEKISFRMALRACGAILIFFGVPVWMFVIALITESVALWLLLICWLLVSYSIAWRVENG
jgi:hypothetical protein